MLETDGKGSALVPCLLGVLVRPFASTVLHPGLSRRWQIRTNEDMQNVRPNLCNGVLRVWVTTVNYFDSFPIMTIYSSHQGSWTGGRCRPVSLDRQWEGAVGYHYVGGGQGWKADERRY